MSNKPLEKPDLKVVTPLRTKRRYLPVAVRYTLITLVGALLAYGVYYGLNKLGY